MMSILRAVRKKPDLAIAGLFALATMALVPFAPRAMLASVNAELLGVLLALMSIVAGLRESGVFAASFALLFGVETSVRRLGQFFVFACFFSSMLITNDVALTIFAPLSITLLTEVRAAGAVVLVVTLETIAANLGSMMTPIGNPQNLFLYNYYQIGVPDFFAIMGPVTLLAGALLYLATLLLPRKAATLPAAPRRALGGRRIVFLGLLFLFALAHVFRVVAFLPFFAVTIGALLVFERRLLLAADYQLLVLFTLLFVGVGNLARIPHLPEMVAGLLGGHEFLAALLLSQVISNVPTTVLLAPFTDAYAPLLLGVNIGGLGTIVASMASIISLRAYLRTPFARTRHYLRIFTLWNVLLLTLLVLFALALLALWR